MAPLKQSAGMSVAAKIGRGGSVKMEQTTWSTPRRLISGEVMTARTNEEMTIKSTTACFKEGKGTQDTAAGVNSVKLEKVSQPEIAGDVVPKEEPVSSRTRGKAIKDDCQSVKKGAAPNTQSKGAHSPEKEALSPKKERASKMAAIRAMAPKKPKAGQKKTKGDKVRQANTLGSNNKKAATVIKTRTKAQQKPKTAKAAAVQAKHKANKTVTVQNGRRTTRCRASAGVIREIMQCQDSVDPLIPKAP